MTVLLGAPRSRISADLLAAARLVRSRSELDDAGAAELLYRDWYLQADPTDGAEVLGQPDPVDIDPAAAYRAAHALDNHYEHGWTARRLGPAGQVLVERDGDTRVVARADVLPLSRRLLPPRVGDTVRVAARRDLLDDAGWWFTFFGGTQPPAQPLRVYWAVRRAAAPQLVAALSALLAAGPPSVLKVGATPALLGRPDAAVLYAPAAWVTARHRSLQAVADQLGNGLAHRVPRLALLLSPGVAVAEEPGSGDSFGEHRCAILARAARRLPSECDEDGLLIGLRAALADAEVDPVAPYRAAGSTLGDEW